MFSARARPEVWADLRNALPFHDGTVDCFYSHHVIEHLPDDALPRHMRDMLRCLKPGGVIRIGGPNAEEAARQLLLGNASWFFDFPDRRTSVGGRYANFLLCRGEHLTLLTPSYLQELLEAAGFVDVSTRVAGQETGHPQLFDEQVLAPEREVAHTPWWSRLGVPRPGEPSLRDSIPSLPHDRRD